MVRMNRHGAPDPAQLMESAATAVVWFDDRTRLAWLNPAAEDLLGVSVLGSRPPAAGEVFRDAPGLSEAIARAVDEQQRISLREYALRLPGGRGEQVVDAILTPMEGNGLLLELVSRDRPRRIIDETLQQGRRDAARQLVRGLAHEIRNPLGGMRGAVQLLARRLKSEELTRYTDVILAEADRIAALVDRMLGPDTLRREAVNIHEPLERVRLLMESEAPVGIRLERDYDPSLPDCPVDRDQLVQVLLNIARNAVQAMGEQGRLRFGTRAVRQVTLGGRRHRVAACIEIEDDGPGIPPHLRDTLFYPLVSGRPGGDGLGLAIANELIARHEGAIECDSRADGTRFSIYLPMTLEGGSAA